MGEVVGGDRIRVRKVRWSIVGLGWAKGCEADREGRGKTATDLRSRLVSKNKP